MSSEIIIEDNLIIEEDQNKIIDTVLSKDFKWYYCHNGVNLNKNRDFNFNIGKNSFQLEHHIISDGVTASDYFEIVTPVFLKISDILKKDIKIFRCKFNFLTPNNNNRHNIPHVDLALEEQKNFKSCIYYVDDSDGNTLFFNQRLPKLIEDLTVRQKVTPKKGKAVIFDSDIFHSSSNPFYYDKRIVLNLVFKVEE